MSVEGTGRNQFVSFSLIVCGTGKPVGRARQPVGTHERPAGVPFHVHHRYGVRVPVGFH